MTFPWLAFFRRRIEMPIRRILLVHYLPAFRQRRLVGHGIEPYIKPEGNWPIGKDK